MRAFRSPILNRLQKRSRSFNRSREDIRPRSVRISVGSAWLIFNIELRTSDEFKVEWLLFKEKQNPHHLNITLNMPYIFFGLGTKSRGATKLAVETSERKLEPCEPSKLKIFPRPITQNPSYTLISNILGHVVATLSFRNSPIFLSSQLGRSFSHQVHIFLSFDRTLVSLLQKRDSFQNRRWHC
jgi:hypothetical protein